MKLYNHLYPDINWCLSTVGETRSKGSIVILLFQNSWDNQTLIYCAWNDTKFYLRDTNYRI